MDASSKVRLIEQFKDFLSETNENMRLYFWVTLFLVVGAMTTVTLSIPDLLNCFTKYNDFVTKLGEKATSWQILNYAFGILIIKLPWALCLSAVFTGLYQLIRNLLLTYEKINQDKRNMSAIYAVSGNIASSLNEYGLSIVTEEFDPAREVFVTVLKTNSKELVQKRENLKWNQIMNYFEGMQKQKIEIPEPEDPNNLKIVTDLLSKAIDKFPSAKV